MKLTLMSILLRFAGSMAVDYDTEKKRTKIEGMVGAERYELKIEEE